jgi:hypothetical protein
MKTWYCLYACKRRGSSFHLIDHGERENSKEWLDHKFLSANYEGKYFAIGEVTFASYLNSRNVLHLMDESVAWDEMPYIIIYIRR